MAGYGETASYGELQYKGDVFVSFSTIVDQLFIRQFIEDREAPQVIQAPVVNNAQDVVQKPVDLLYTEVIENLFIRQFTEDYNG